MRMCTDDYTTDDDAENETDRQTSIQGDELIDINNEDIYRRLFNGE